MKASAIKQPPVSSWQLFTPCHIKANEPMNVTASSTLHDQLRINYEAWGEGYPAILIHGWPQTSHAWRQLMPLLGHGFTLIAPDMPGCGFSSRQQAGYDKRTVAKHLARMMESLGYDRYFVVEHDMGCQISYAPDAHHRDKVVGLVFIESGLAGTGLENDMNVATGGSWHFGFNMAGDRPEMLVHVRETQFMSFHLFLDRIGVVSADNMTDSNVVVYASALRRPSALRGSLTHYKALFDGLDHNREQIRTPLGMPVLAVSKELGYRDGARQVMEWVESVIIRDSAHYIPEEQPEALATALLQFFAKHRLTENIT